MASFDENGKYIKTNWKAGDKITATKLNKIEESIEAVNDNDISRHVEVDARLDALEAKDVAHDKELTNIKNTIADNKAAAELGDYEINSRMTFLEEELNDGIEEVHNVAETVDSKIAKVEADMEAMVAEVEADTEAMVAEVEVELNNFEAEVRDNYQIKTEGRLLPDSTESYLGSAEQPWTGIFLQNGIAMESDSGSCGISAKGFFCYESVLELQGGASDSRICIDSDNTVVFPDGGSWELGSNTNRWASFYSSPFNLFVEDNGFTSQLKANRGNFRIVDGSDNSVLSWSNDYHILGPDATNHINLGSENFRFKSLYLNAQPNVSSDRTLKENIKYVNSDKSNVSYEDMYAFVKDYLELATYNLVEHDKLNMGFIAQDLLVNLDGTDNKVGQMIVNPVAVPTEEEIEEGKPYPTLSYDMGMYISVLAGALKESINKIEQLEARIQELENK